MERLCAHCAVSRARHHAIALLWAVWPEWTGPGRARSPLTLRLALTPERWTEEQATRSPSEQPKSCPFY